MNSLKAPVFLFHFSRFYINYTFYTFILPSRKSFVKHRLSRYVERKGNIFLFSKITIITFLLGNFVSKLVSAIKLLILFIFSKFFLYKCILKLVLCKYIWKDLYYFLDIKDHFFAHLFYYFVFDDIIFQINYRIVVCISMIRYLLFDYLLLTIIINNLSNYKKVLSLNSKR